MILVYILILAAFSWPSTHLWLRYRKSPEQKPMKAETTGIFTCTGLMVVYLAVLMYRNYFF